MLDSLSWVDAKFLRDLSHISSRMQRAQNQMSSGLKVHTASDAPDEIGRMLQLRAGLESNAQTRTNLGRVKSEVDSAESTLENAVSLMDQVRTLGAEGASSFQTPESRQVLAAQVGTLLEQMVGLTQYKVDGRFIFSGDSDSVAPYTFDGTATPPVSLYGGTSATRAITLPNGSRIPIAATAQQIFDSPVAANNVFAAVTALRDALQADDETAIGTAVTQVSSASTYLNQQLGFYGTVQNQISQALKDADTQELQFKTELSGIEEADIASAILELQMATTQQSAALAAKAQVPRTSLFDYLK